MTKTGRRMGPTTLLKLDEVTRIAAVESCIRDQWGIEAEIRRTVRGARVTFELWVGRAANVDPWLVEVRYTPEGFLYPGCKTERIARSCADRHCFFVAGR